MAFLLKLLLMTAVVVLPGGLLLLPLLYAVHRHEARDEGEIPTAAVTSRSA